MHCPQNNQEKKSRRAFSSFSCMDTTGFSLVCWWWQPFSHIADLKAFSPSQEANILACQFLQRCCATLFNAETSGHLWQPLNESVQLRNAVYCQGTKQLTSLAALPSCLQEHGTEGLVHSRNKSRKADLDDRWNCCSQSYHPTNSQRFVACFLPNICSRDRAGGTESSVPFVCKSWAPPRNAALPGSLHWTVHVVGEIEEESCCESTQLLCTWSHCNLWSYIMEMKHRIPPEETRLTLTQESAIGAKPKCSFVLISTLPTVHAIADCKNLHKVVAACSHWLLSERGFGMGCT